MTASRASWLRLAGRVLAIAGVILAVVAVRVITSSRAELDEGNRLRARGDLEGAVVHYRRAARWYTPGNPYCADALGKLAWIARRAERTGDVDLALSAYRGIRAAIMSTRSFYTPHADRLAAADARIADLMASLPPPPIDAGKSREELRREHLELLQADPRPNILWTFVLLLGFAAWIGGALLFVTKAIDEEDRIVGPEARRWGTVVIVGFGLFVLGMALA
jgi:hypothetical protein